MRLVTPSRANPEVASSGSDAANCAAERVTSSLGRKPLTDAIPVQHTRKGSHSRRNKHYQAVENQPATRRACASATDEEGFGWMKTVAGFRKTKYRGIEKVGWAFTLAAVTYKIRLPRLLAEQG